VSTSLLTSYLPADGVTGITAEEIGLEEAKPGMVHYNFRWTEGNADSEVWML
jgi:hypothetical protein